MEESTEVFNLPQAKILIVLYSVV